MSGGHFDYMCYRIEETYSGQMEDEELNDLLKDFTKLLHDLEWWQSADYGEEDYRETVTKFKNKWLKQYNKENCYEYCIHKKFTKEAKKILKEIEGQNE